MYWHVNNAVSNVAPEQYRDVGGDRLTLVDASRFGAPSPAAPLRASIFRGGVPLTILRCVGRDGNELLIDGAADGYNDEAIGPGDLVVNTPTAGDFNDVAEAIAALKLGNVVEAVEDKDGGLWQPAVAAFLESSDPKIVRVVDAGHGLPVSVVDGLSFPDDMTVNLADGSTVALAPGTSVGVSGPVTISQSNQVNLRGTSYQGGAWTVGLAPGSSVNVAGAVELASDAKVGINGPVAAEQSGAWRVASVADVGALVDGETPLTPAFKAISASDSGDNVIVAAVAGKRIRVLRWGLTAKGEVDAKWRSGSADVTGERPLTKYASAGGAYCPVGVFETAPGQALNLNLSAAVAVGGELTYVLV